MAPPPVRAAAHPALAAALALVVVLLGAAAPASAQSNNPKANSAIVIGAGMAGLAAADALCAKGFSVTVLEGRQRIGGRTYTAKLAGSGAPVEVGAGWLHDADPARNVLADFAIENGLPTLVDDDEELAWLIGGPPPAVGKQDPAKTAAWQAKAEEFGDLAAAAEDNWPASKPLLNYFNAWVAAERLAGDELAGVKAILQSDVGDLEYGAPMSKINAQWSGEGEQGDGEERLLAGEGYSGITALLERRIRARPACANAFSLGAKVTQITVTPSPAARRGVHVRVGNGTVLSAKFAVTTLPLGVLKAGGVNFNPNLTAAKRAAMDRLSMGLLNKVALVYEDAWWEEDGAGGAESPGASSWFVPAYPKAPAEGNAFEFWNHNRFFKGSNAVVMLLGGDTAIKWEKIGDGKTTKLKDKLVADKADALFRSLFPSKTAVLNDYVVTRWQADPWSGGAYSYMGVGGTPAVRSRLCAPQGNLLFWAGEHCSLTLPSTAPGAFGTGVAAAADAMKVFPAPGGSA